MLNISESPNDAKESLLSSAREGSVAKVLLSKQACLGILLRSEKRKNNTKLLQSALQDVAQVDKT